MGHWNHVAIGVWAVPGTVELVEAQTALMKQLCEEVPRFPAVHLVIKRAALPSGEAREAYQELARRYAPHMTCVGLLIEGDGFWASAVRAFLTGAVMLERRLRTKAFGDLRELSVWVAAAHNEGSAETFDAEALHAALEWMLQQPTVRDYRLGL